MKALFKQFERFQCCRSLNRQLFTSCLRAKISLSCWSQVADSGLAFVSSWRKLARPHLTKTRRNRRARLSPTILDALTNPDSIPAAWRRLSVSTRKFRRRSLLRVSVRAVNERTLSVPSAGGTWCTCYRDIPVVSLDFPSVPHTPSHTHTHTLHYTILCWNTGMQKGPGNQHMDWLTLV